jgi:enterochelin esterase family protein
MNVEAMAAQLRAMLPGLPEGDSLRFAGAMLAGPAFDLPAEAQAQEGVPRGTLRELRHTSQGAYPGVSRTLRVYEPAHGSDGPRALIVFQDGSRYLGPEANAVNVLDHLIHQDVLPPTVALFIEPGEQGPGLPIYGGPGNRSIEYDSIGPVYACFLIEELIPFACEGLNLTEDRSQRAIVGLSSGGCCAFNAAWERPDFFSKVLSHCGSFVNLRGGHLLAPAVRVNEELKDLRVWLQTGEQDLDIVFGNWPLANRELASALAYRGYEHRLVVGPGGHSLGQGGAMLGESLRWLWSPR